MKEPSRITDAKLDEAVAMECGFVSHLMRDAGGPIYRFSPTSDARDAEMVWSWLLEHGPEVQVTRCHPKSGKSEGNVTWHGVNCLESVPHGGMYEPIRSINWKRALCEAALMVVVRERKA